MTFSVVGTDGRAMCVTVASKFLAVGSVVPEVRLDAERRLLGAAATQASAKWSYKIDAVRLLESGVDAEAAVRQVTDADAERSHRQLGVVGVDSQATYTGSDCLDWAGGRAGTDEGGGRYAIQGNILVGEHVVADMERAWFESAGSPLERRLIAVLLAGDAAGGDARGRQSAALLVVAPGEGYDGSGVRVDLRVDDHADAPRELARVLDLSELYFGSAEDVEPLTGELGAEVGDRLHRLGYDGPVAQALAEWAGVEN